ncbi:hypothetical protein RHSIM_RhsimUnG0080900 [Rhododendron simsii]|uniref:Uncharacterized protein n=1 Tax=Rhododendron simsii TaxID=118357 RepID=A0A834FYV6_RHOSS|nr:hypothetical protein RHSIM_RhsimUnG0080900 [Rhododendron simsii]
METSRNSIRTAFSGELGLKERGKQQIDLKRGKEKSKSENRVYMGNETNVDAQINEVSVSSGVDFIERLKDEDLVRSEEGCDEKLEELERRNGDRNARRARQLMKRSNMLAKQVISIQSALSLGFVSQLWVDTVSWVVLVVEVRPNLLSGESERFFLEDVSQVGDVVLIPDESVLENDFHMVGLETLYSKLSKPYASSASCYLTSLLPLPHLPPPSDPLTSEILRYFHDVSAPILSLHADALPIDIALSKFFSYVVPRPVAVDVENRDFDPLYVLSVLLRIRRSAIAALVAFVHRHQDLEDGDLADDEDRVRSIVLERSKRLASGGAIGIHSKGWHALDQLGVGSKLRETAIRVLHTLRCLESAAVVDPVGGSAGPLSGLVDAVEDQPESRGYYAIRGGSGPGHVHGRCVGRRAASDYAEAKLEGLEVVHDGDGGGGGDGRARLIWAVDARRAAPFTMIWWMAVKFSMDTISDSLSCLSRGECFAGCDQIRTNCGVIYKWEMATKGNVSIKIEDDDDVEVGDHSEPQGLLAECIKTLNAMEDLDGASYTKGMKLLKDDPSWRPIFLGMSEQRKDFIST